MNKIRLTALGLALAVVLSCCEAKKPPELAQPPAAKPAGPKKRVGIFAFKNKSRYGQDKLTQAAVDILYSELEKSGLFELYERADLAELQKEYDLIESGNVNPVSAAERGKLVGVQAVIIGSITQFGIKEEGKDYGVYQKKVEIAEATVDVRVVDTTTGKIITADSGTGRAEQTTETTLGFGSRASFDETLADKALRAAMDQFINGLIRRLEETPWEGRVADTDLQDGRQILYVNAGRKSSMPMAATLTVYRISGKITDPETGAFLGYKTQRLGTAQVFEFTGEDLSLARAEPGLAAVKKGDLVVFEQDAGK